MHACAVDMYLLGEEKEREMGRLVGYLLAGGCVSERAG